MSKGLSITAFPSRKSKPPCCMRQPIVGSRRGSMHSAPPMKCWGARARYASPEGRPDGRTGDDSGFGMVALTCRQRQRSLDGGLDFRRLGGKRITQPPELPPQIVDLVEQSEDQRESLVVNRKFPADLDDQLDARHINLVENPGPATALRQHPTVFNPPGELAPVELGEAVEQLLQCNHPGVP